MSGRLEGGAVEEGVPLLASRPDPVHCSHRLGCLAKPGLAIFSLVTGLLVALGVGGAAGGATPLGPQFQVNTHTNSSQSCCTVAADADGGFVVVGTRHGNAGRGVGASRAVLLLASRQGCDDKSPMGWAWVTMGGTEPRRTH
jgi:hypothetical protein